MLQVTVAVDHGPRVDVALSAQEPVALLLADLAPVLGVAEPVVASLAGHPLSTARALGEQGVVNGAVICLSPASESLPTPLIRPDPATELAENVRAQVRPWRPSSGWRGWWMLTTVAVLAVAPAWQAAPQSTVAMATASLMALLVLTAWTLPAIALALCGPDPARCRRVAVVGLRGVGLSLGCASVGGICVGPLGAALAVTCSVLVGLRGRLWLDPPVRVEAWTATCVGLLTVLAGVLVVWSDRWWWLLGGLATVGVVGQIPVPNLVRRRVAEVVELLALTALPPLVAGTAGVVAAVQR
ncbi:MAG: EsaB/YukD family protein [Nocardioides sp.]